MIHIELRLFGAFRKYSESASIAIEIPNKCSVSSLKESIAMELKRRRPDLSESKLVFESALANENEILRDQEEIQASCSLAILPPVCGG